MRTAGRQLGYGNGGAAPRGDRLGGTGGPGSTNRGPRGRARTKGLGQRYRLGGTGLGTWTGDIALVFCPTLLLTSCLSPGRIWPSRGSPCCLPGIRPGRGDHQSPRSASAPHPSAATLDCEWRGHPGVILTSWGDEGMDSVNCIYVAYIDIGRRKEPTVQNHLELNGT